MTVFVTLKKSNQYWLRHTCKHNPHKELQNMFLLTSTETFTYFHPLRFVPLMGVPLPRVTITRFKRSNPRNHQLVRVRLVVLIETVLTDVKDRVVQFAEVRMRRSTKEESWQQLHNCNYHKF